MIIADIFQSLFNFKHYKAMAQKTKGYVFLYALILIVIMAAGGYALTNSFIAKIPDLLKTLPSFEIKNGELLINDGRPYTLELPAALTKGQTYNGKPVAVVYSPALEFPPTESDFAGLGTPLIVTKKGFFVFDGNRIQERLFDFKENSPKITGAELAQKWPASSETASVLKYAVIIAVVIFTLITIVYWFVVNLLLGLVINAFMSRELPRGALPKTALYLVTPVLALTALNVFLPVRIPLFNLLLICACGFYLHQIFRNYPRKAVDAA